MGAHMLAYPTYTNGTGRPAPGAPDLPGPLEALQGPGSPMALGQPVTRLSKVRRRPSQ